MRAVPYAVADAVRAVLVVLAFVAAARARYAFGIAAAMACALVLGIEVFLALRFPAPTGRLEIALAAVFLGPSAMPHAPPIPATRLLMDPTHHLGTAALSALAARTAFSRAALLPPDALPSRRLDQAGLRFVALAVLATLLFLSRVSGDALD